MSFDPEALGFDLLPDDELSAEDDLAAAAEAALADPDSAVAESEEAPLPFGNSWAFDWEAGQFYRAGASPAPVSGFDTIREWCMMVVHSARYAHAVFSDEFGVEDPEQALGELDEDEFAGDLEEHYRAGLLGHDRVAGVTLRVEFDPVEGVVYLRDLVVTTDEDEEFAFGDLQLARES